MVEIQRKIAVLLCAGIMCLSPSRVLAPTLPLQEPQRYADNVQQIRHISVGDDLAPTQQISRGEPAPTVERRVMRVTAYTKNDAGMNGRGITTSGVRVAEGQTIAADSSIPFGTEIYIPALGRTYTVTDRGGAIYSDRLDLYMEKRKDALRFGVQELEVFIRRE